jgi:hypothetical protein
MAGDGAEECEARVQHAEELVRGASSNSRLTSDSSRIRTLRARLRRPDLAIHCGVPGSLPGFLEGP